jgi:hypothetical protein
MRCKLFLISIILPNIVLANGFNPVFSGKLEGNFETGGSYHSDTTPEQTKLKHFYYFEITGDAAEKMYKSMPISERRSECWNAFVKEQDGISCRHRDENQYFKGSRYVCEFSIDLEKATVGPTHGTGCS